MSEIDVEELRREIRFILKDADLNSLSSKKVRQMLENHFHCDFTSRKKEIDDILMEEITNKDPIEAGTSDEQPRNETSDEEKPSSSSSPTKRSKKKRKSEEKPSKPSDEELAMIIHQEENRPSLRHSRPTVRFFAPLFPRSDWIVLRLEICLDQLIVLVESKIGVE